MKHLSLYKWLIAFSSIAVCTAADAQTISTYAGGIGEDSNAVVYGRLSDPKGVVLDASGNFYIVDGPDRKVTPATGKITTFDNSWGGSYVYMSSSWKMYVSIGNQVFITDTLGNRTLVAGTGGGGFSGDGSAATAAQLNNPIGLAIDNIGNLYIADAGNGRVRKVDTTGVITTLAGGGPGSYGGMGGPAISAGINKPYGVAADGYGNVYIATGTTSEIDGAVLKVNSSGIISAFTGLGGRGSLSGMGGPATAALFSEAYDIRVDAAGNVYFSIPFNYVICKVNTAGIINVFAGGGSSFADGVPAISASIQPYDITFDASGNLYFVDNYRRGPAVAPTLQVRKVNTSGIISTIAGNNIPYAGYSGDGGNPLLAEFSSAQDVTKDLNGNLYLIDGNGNQVRKISPAYIVSTYAGNGIVGFSGDGGPASAAELDAPSGLGVDKSGNLYIADAGTEHIRKISPSGTITTIAGGGTSGLGDGGPATAAEITVADVAADSLGNVYFTDPGYARIRKVNTLTGIITTIGGNGTAGNTGDGGPATAAEINAPGYIAVAPNGTAYFTCASGLIREINTSGTITTFAGGGSITGGGVPATDASINPNGLSLDKYGNLYIADNGGYVYAVDTSGIIHLVAGGGPHNFWCEDVPATSSGISGPGGIAIDTSGNLFISCMSSTNPSIRKVCCLGNYNDDPPLFTHGSAQGIFICTSSGPVSIDTLMKISDPDIGRNEQWAIYRAPSAGTLTGFPDSAISTGGVITPSGMYYTPAAGYSGTDNFEIQISNGVERTFTTVTVTINPLPSASISGPSLVCTGATISLSGSSSTGVWSISNGNATITPGGAVHGISTGTDTVYYTITTTCGSSVASQAITISATPSPGTIIGPSSLCTGSSTVLTDTSSGGSWACTGPYASIGASTGLLIGYAAGPTTVTYTVTNSCGTVTATKNILIAPPPYAGVITGGASICTGGTIPLTDTTSGGVWSSANPLIATVGSTGMVTGVAVGSAVISYTITGGCGPGTAIAIVNVTAASPIDPITGASSVCTGFTTPLADATPGGTWSSSDPAVATIGSTGVVSGVAAGVVAISYSGSLGCGGSVATSNITVNSSVSAGLISGSATVCTGAATLLTSYISGGAWTCSNGSATAGPTGIITGVSPGTDTVTYTVTNSCGTATTTHIITVYPAPVPGTISGSSSVCTGGTLYLTDGAPGGVWSSANTAIGTVSGSGAVAGIAAGTTVISYTASTGCGSAAAVAIVTVNAPSAGLITGVTTLCAGGSSTVSDAVGGGTWSISSTAVATIGSTGMVNAIAPGTAIISYTATGACGAATSTAILTVGALPVVSAIAGTPTICSGTTTILIDATLGGTWSSSNPAVGTIGSAGTFSAISAGSTTISYLVTAGCGATGVVFPMAINATPMSGAISGSPALCAGAAAPLTESVSGGIWSSNDTSVATIGTSGTVTGVAAGNATISYTSSNVCGAVSATHFVTVNPLPNAGSISGSADVCVAAATPLLSSVTGGNWISGNTAIATVGSASGAVSGIFAGTATILYTVSNTCGTDTATKAMTVNPLPHAGTISAPAVICVGASDTLSDTAAGGAWSSSLISIASVGSSSGLVSGINAGAVTISYTVNNVCGTAIATKPMTVNPLPNAGAISGSSVICALTTTTLSDADTGGVWSSSNTAVATAGSATGVVLGVSSGPVVISYTVTNSCGAASALQPMLINALPHAGSISGDSTVCSSANISLTDTASGGIWSSSDAATATVGSSGMVTGGSAGTVTISYSVTNSCGTATASRHIRVMAPDAGLITGVTTLCAGGSATLADSVSGGTWSSSTPSVATIGSSSGMLTGVGAGTAIISYTATNSCGNATTYTFATISSLPSVSPVVGAAAICAGTNTTLTDASVGGAWSSSDTLIATVNNVGKVTGISAGTVTISYLVTAGCGTAGSTLAMQVQEIPSAGTITGNSIVCLHTTTQLTDSTDNGVWASSDPYIASVSNLGAVLGADTGTATISYSVTNTCGTATDTFTETVYTTVYPGIIEGGTSLCVGATGQLTCAVAGGVWSSSVPAVATVSAAGVVSGISAGSAAVSYAVANNCGAGISSALVTIDQLPYVAPITGVFPVSAGDFLTLYDATGGGTWSSSDTGVATVNQGGIVTGISAGTATVTYSIVNSFGCTADTTVQVTITGSGINSTFDVFPNPNRGILTVRWAEQIVGQSEVAIFDVLGQVVYKNHFNITTPAGEAQLDIHGLISGSYFVVIKSVTVDYTGKLIYED